MFPFAPRIAFRLVTKQFPHGIVQANESAAELSSKKNERGIDVAERNLRGRRYLTTKQRPSRRLSITATSNMEEVAAPQSVQRQVYTSDTIRVFAEQQAFTLTEDVTVDVSNPGQYAMSSPGDFVSAVIPAGTVVDSYLIHCDPLTQSWDFEVQGSVTFDGDIIGIMVFYTSLVDTDAMLGASGTTYSPYDPGNPFNDPPIRRGLEYEGGPNPLNDVFDVGVNSVGVNLQIPSIDHMDEVRVLTTPGGGGLFSSSTSESEGSSDSHSESSSD